MKLEASHLVRSMEFKKLVPERDSTSFRDKCSRKLIRYSSTFGRLWFPMVFGNEPCMVAILMHILVTEGSVYRGINIRLLYDSSPSSCNFITMTYI